MTKFTDRLRSGPGLALSAAALLVTGGALGAGAALSTRPPVVMAPASPVPIASLAQASRPWIGEPVVTVRGRVAEVYGARFVLADASGRTLVETGPRADVSGLVAPNQPMTVQGRYQDGVIRASYLVGPDGRVAALGPRGGRHGGRHHGHGGGPGPDDRFAPDAPPAPTAAVDGNSAIPTG